METREDILRELREIAPKLAVMEKTNPYSLPEGYFMNFGKDLLSRVNLSDAKAELGKVAPTLANLNAEKVAEVPSSYFKTFSAKMLADIRAKEVVNELTEIAPELSVIEKTNIHQVPAAYFSRFPQAMAEKIKAIQQTAEPSMTWVDKLNETLDTVIALVFKPKYAVAFAGVATIVILGMMMMVKIEQCSDLDCKFAQLSADEINNYFNNKSDSYSDEVFEGNFSEVQLPAPLTGDKDNSMRAYKEALKDVDDASLDAAISN
jgi:hypothetical protein